MRVKKGDLVQILSGKDRGKQGRVIEAYPRDGRVIVENLNVVKRHTRPKPIQSSSRMGGPQVTPGGVIDKAAPLPVGNVMVVCPVCKRPTRVGMTVKEAKSGREKTRVRHCKRADCGQEIDK
ncbi:MAG: 50S ribosomal protein L24 [Actinomycetota bacterium]|nr:50S ribosomal protein L24 [Actinomycetota bacterium]